MSRSQLHISEVAQLVGVTPKTVRHYHKLGLMPEMGRSEGGYRLYGANDLLRLQRIKRLQSLGLSLQQIKFILEADHPDSLLLTTLQSIRCEIDQQMEKLTHRRQRIDQYLNEQATLSVVDQPEEESALLQQLSALFPGYPSDVPTELIEFDRAFFGRLESFHWPPEHQSAFLQVTQQFIENPRMLDYCRFILERMVLLGDLPEDDPRVISFAWEVAESDIGTFLRQFIDVEDTPENPFLSAMSEVMETMNMEMLSPAQGRFLQFLPKMLKRIRTE
jgi:DNA-binding transcriptional MerR regulator